MLNSLCWWLGVADIVILTGAVLIVCGRLLIEALWKLLRAFPFWVRVIRLGIAAEVAPSRGRGSKLRAMRDCTSDMEIAGAERWFCEAAMIDAALSEDDVPAAAPIILVTPPKWSRLPRPLMTTRDINHRSDRATYRALDQALPIPEDQRCPNSIGRGPRFIPASPLSDPSRSRSTPTA